MRVSNASAKSAQGRLRTHGTTGLSASPILRERRQIDKRPGPQLRPTSSDAVTLVSSFASSVAPLSVQRYAPIDAPADVGTLIISIFRSLLVYVFLHLGGRYLESAFNVS